MKSKLFVGIVAALSTLAAAHVARASQGSWTKYAGGGPGGYTDGDSSGTYFQGLAVSAANGYVHAISPSEYLYRWDGSAWDGYSSSYNALYSVFSPIGDDTYSVLFIDNGNIIHGYHCGFFMCYASYSGSGFHGTSVAGTSGNPYAVGATHCGTYDYCIYQYSSGTWSQVGTQGGQMVTVDVSDSNHYPWTVTTSGTIYKWNGSAWVNANAPTNATIGQIAVSNGSVWGIEEGTNHVWEWEYGSSSWVDHTTDMGAPGGSLDGSSISVATGNTGAYVPWVYAVTSAAATYDPETLWFWACTNCTQAPSP